MIQFRQELRQLGQKKAGQSNLGVRYRDSVDHAELVAPDLVSNTD